MRKQDSVKNISCSLFVCLAVGMIVGCGTKSDSVAASSEVGAAPSPGAASSGDVAQKFLAELEAQPVEKRKGYVDSHQTEANLVAKSSDPQVTEKFYTLMMPKMALPNKP